eukprot:3364203-Pyramimonas_sp.AAC.2
MEQAERRRNSAACQQLVAVRYCERVLVLSVGISFTSHMSDTSKFSGIRGSVRLDSRRARRLDMVRVPPIKIVRRLVNNEDLNKPYDSS